MKKIWIAMLVLLLCACSSQALDKELIAIEVLDKDGQLLMSGQVFENEGLQYLSLSDFVDLSNLMNEDLKLIKNLKKGDYDKGNHRLAITYRADANVKDDMILAMVSVGFNLKNRSVDGKDYSTNLDFSEGVFKYHKIGDTIYLPLEAIRTFIYNGDLYLLKKDDYKYVLYDKNRINDLVKEEAFFKDIKSNNQYMQGLKQMMLISNTGGAVGEVTDYNQYYYELLKILDIRDDYHAYVFPVEDLSTDRLSDLGYPAFIKQSNYYKYVKLFTSDDPQVTYKKLNHETMYLDIDSFFIDELMFESRINHFLSDLDEETTRLIVDLRNNRGGWISSSSKLLSVFLKNISMNLTYKVGDELVSLQTYQLEQNSNRRDYEVTILVNESSASASLYFANIMKDNMDVYIIGSEPLNKQAYQKVYFQLIDGTLISKSSDQYALSNNEGIDFNDLILVDKVMNDDQIEAFLESFK
ncbi:S41 family peptidase [Acidaminobacter sp. JC074]|uniref:S41 family peptidase n=1 Tax=Acidaminobacter sp. JC074 TaxID=2530199 RepID=UPI001F112CA7|nr:S41 family peptidase [Acidaminobacter sp. JC074]